MERPPRLVGGYAEGRSRHHWARLTGHKDSRGGMPGRRESQFKDQGGGLLAGTRQSGQVVRAGPKPEDWPRVRAGDRGPAVSGRCEWKAAHEILRATQGAYHQRGPRHGTQALTWRS